MSWCFPEGFAAALNLHLSALKLHLFDAPKGAKPCNRVQESNPLQPLGNAAQRDVTQSGATECMAGGGGFEPPLTGPEPVVLPLDDPPSPRATPLY
jgi:hypothetical protein